jgi:IS1 family transposase
MDMNKLSTQRRAQIIRCLVEGNSVRATCRMTDSSKDAVLKLVADAGKACLEYQREHLRNLTCKRIQCDEIWSFVYSKAKNVPAEFQGQFGYGDVWTWTAIDADTKLVPCWLVGTRGAQAATTFMRDLASRLANRVQLTTDGHRVYLNAVDEAFDRDIDYAMLVKHYAATPEGEVRYSPAVCTGCEKTEIRGRPDPDHISTSYVERQNLNMRMGMRRFTRLTNAFSKKVENHGHAIALFYMYYNFARIHQTLRCTPAMEAGVSDHVWSIEEIGALVP